MQESTIAIGTTIAIIIGGVAYFLFRKKPTSPKSEKQQTTPIQQTSQDHIEEQSIPSNEKNQKKDGKKKSKRANNEAKEEEIKTKKIKNQKQIEQAYSEYYYGTISLKASNSMHTVTAVCMKNSKILTANTKNELVLYDLKKWKKDAQNQDRYFTSLDNNNASAVMIGNQYYYAALTFEKTISYYEFKGGEGGVYFRQVFRFPRNILKSDASSLYVPESQKFVVSTGSAADAIINVWSMKGERLVNLNSYQIQHYGIDYGNNKVCIRGWTSQVKVFVMSCDKEGNFNKLQKGAHLAHEDHPKCSSIDNFGLYTLTASASKIILWSLHNSQSSQLVLKTIYSCALDIEEVQVCKVHTIKDSNQRFRTLTVFSDFSKIVICDRSLMIQKVFEGVDCKQLYVVGSMKNVVLASLSSLGKLTIWNITALVQTFDSYAEN